jgi:cell division protein FtsQ
MNTSPRQAQQATFDVRLMQWSARLCLVAASVLAMAALGLYIARLPVFAIKSVVVQGELSKVNEGALQSAATTSIDGTLFTAGLMNIKSTIEETPWVRSAVVRRQFPSGLVINLTEHVAVANWGYAGNDDDTRMLNSFGEIFEANGTDVESENLVHLSGPDDRALEVLAMYRLLARTFSSASLQLSELRLSGRGTWLAKIDTGAAIELGAGTPDEIVARTRAFLITMPKISAQLGRTMTHLESADLRHPNAYALRLRGVGTNILTAPEANSSQPLAN